MPVKIRTSDKLIPIIRRIPFRGTGRLKLVAKVRGYRKRIGNPIVNGIHVQSARRALAAAVVVPH